MQLFLEPTRLSTPHLPSGLIDQDELRFGKDSNQKRAFQCDDIDPRGKGDGGFYAQVSLTKWYHIDCLKLSQKARQQLLAQPSKLAGYTELRPADQQVRPHSCAALHGVAEFLRAQIITVLLAAPQAPPRRVQPKPTLTALQRRMVRL